MKLELMIGSTENNLNMIGTSPPMTEVFDRIRSVASSKAPVFITGETGTGKELCAAAIHRFSNRAAGPVIAINCGAIPRELVESELFGHLRGAFTGAIADRRGAVALAHGGTLFLDEVCEMEVAQQSKLLRFLQTGEFRPIGSSKLQKSDLRIICATNRCPLEEVKAGRFREDLYFRLRVLSITMPPLRERGSDILALARHFLAIHAREEKKSFLRLSSEAELLLSNYDWPGNVRELENSIREAVVLNDGEVLETKMLSLQPQRTSSPDLAALPSVSNLPTSFFTRKLRLIERDIIEGAVSACGGSLPRAARVLGVSPSTLYRKRESWELPSRH
jgi:DNA-binding NtrC family response regulator